MPETSSFRDNLIFNRDSLEIPVRAKRLTVLRFEPIEQFLAEIPNSCQWSPYIGSQSRHFTLTKSSLGSNNLIATTLLSTNTIMPSELWALEPKQIELYPRYVRLLKPVVTCRHGCVPPCLCLTRVRATSTEWASTGGLVMEAVADAFSPGASDLNDHARSHCSELGPTHVQPLDTPTMRTRRAPVSSVPAYRRHDTQRCRNWQLRQCINQWLVHVGSLDDQR